MAAPRKPRLAGEAMSAYEQSRAERIKENISKMQKLGIFDLSLNLKINSPPAKTSRRNYNNNNKTPPVKVSPLIRSAPTRRSSRLKNGTPVSYSEVEFEKKNKVCENEDFVCEVGSRPEIYTEEHEKLLGSTEKSWTLFVDGYGRDGKRIYDQVRGQTCHQCRQKTLGYRTHCIECNKVQGQFCGDCLYMRYGEHVLEARENPEWICPVCRGICNCSLCRQAKGWAPTGTLYKKITKLGYKSVAHYLILTHRLEVNPENNQDSVNEVSARRSLAFSDVDPVSEVSVKVTDDDKPGSFEKLKDKDVDELKDDSEKDSVKLHFSSETPASVCALSQIEFSPVKEMKEENPATPNLKQSSSIVAVDPNTIAGRLKQRRTKTNDCDEETPVFPANEVKKPIELLPSDVKHNGDGNTSKAKTPKVKQELALTVVPTEDSIAGRLKKRVFFSMEKEADQESTKPELQMISSTIVTVGSDSVAGRLKRRRNKTSGNEEEKQIVALTLDVNYLGDGDSSMTKTPIIKQLTLATVPSEDSIAGRLRQRRKTGD